MPHPPLIGVPACFERVRDMDYHIAGDKYLRAVAGGAGGLPFVFPALGPDLVDPDALVARLDGLFLTGSPSNVEPHRYAGPASRAGTKHDPARDATVLPVIERALAADLPLLALCRGHQELNVVLGGTLHQLVEEMPRFMNHQADRAAPVEERYAPAHTVAVEPGSWLEGVAGAREITVNSLHSQAIDRLGDGLVVEGRAPDGLIEAVRLPGRRFVVGIQWHPEWDVGRNPVSGAIFAAFGAAVRERASGRAGRAA